MLIIDLLLLFRQKMQILYYKILLVINMKVKVIDEGHEKDLEDAINTFLENTDKEIVDIKFQTAVSIDHDEQIYCFSALIMYK